MDQEQVLERMRRSGALLEGHFLLSSGRHSDRYFQCALVLAHPKIAEELARAVAVQLAALRVDVVVGPALGAVVWAQEVGRALGTRALFTERENGQMVLRRGFQLKPGERALVVEDAITTGGSVREVLAIVRAQGAKPVGVAGIVNRSGHSNPFEADGLAFACLAEVQAESWPPGDCPLCASGRAGPAIKPGSRSQPAPASTSPKSPVPNPRGS
jgi:orotate phosphoribosyltransferase